MKESRGFTLIEMVVVLAVIAILAAVLTPIITSYVEKAKYNAAMNDLKNIAASVLQFDSDTKVWPIYATAADIPNGTVNTVEYTPGDVPTAGVTATGWQNALGNTGGSTSVALESILNANSLNLTTSGVRAWKGAYLNLAADPWGSAYYLTSANLEPSSTNAAYVISAGPNQTIETPLINVRTGTLTPTGDDLIVRIK